MSWKVSTYCIISKKTHPLRPVWRPFFSKSRGGSRSESGGFGSISPRCSHKRMARRLDCTLDGFFLFIFYLFLSSLLLSGLTLWRQSASKIVSRYVVCCLTVGPSASVKTRRWLYGCAWATVPSPLHAKALAATLSVCRTMPCWIVSASQPVERAFYSETLILMFDWSSNTEVPLVK